MKKLTILLIAVTFLLFSKGLSAQTKLTLSTMPRIDVHAHVGGIDGMESYMEVRKVLKEKYNTDLAMWINLQCPLGPGSEGIDMIKEVQDKYQGRFLPTINDYRINDGLRFSPDELSEWKSRGIVGYKIWVGVSEAIDNPENDPTFTKMEQIGMVGASIHISQPYPRNCKDPIEFWKSINAWERVLDRHPNLVVVNAHMMDIFYSNEQLEYLDYFMQRYPNSYLDVSARLKDFYSMDTEKIRSFFIKYADRIMFGTDISSQPKKDGPDNVAAAYDRCFKILETNGVFESELFSPIEGKKLQGIALPVDVLEKIYYKNAMKVYPRVRDELKKLGYNVD